VFTNKIGIITGIAGLIGSTLAKKLLKENWQIIGIDDLSGGYVDNVPKSVHFIQKDVLQISEHDVPIKMYNARTQKIDAVFHCAASAHEGLSVFSPSYISRNIYSGTMNIAALAIQLKVKMFINFSSMARYGDIQAPFKETDTCNPVDPYGLAKLQVEEQLKLLSVIYPEFKYVTVVPHNVSGAGQVYTDPYRNVMSIMSHLAIKGKDLYVYGEGDQKRSFSHVDDCVESIYRIVEKWSFLDNGEIFNIGPEGNEIPIYKLANTIIQLTKSESKIRYLDARPQEVKIAHCSSEKARIMLDYSCTKTVEDILKEIIDFIKIRGLEDFEYKLNQFEIISDKIPQTWTKKLF